jgi:acetyltransferase
MSIRHLDFLFRPRSVALIGASDRPHSVGATVLRNLLQGGFDGPVYPVNSHHQMLEGQVVYAEVAQLPQAPDLAVICTPPAAVPGVIAQLGAIGCRAAVVLTAGLSAMGEDGRTLRQAMQDAARPYLLRILGPNCVGLLVPGIGLNASFAHMAALPGRLAFVSQSGALVTGILDWAQSRQIGFSRFISLGDSTDVDFGDVLDYLAADPETDAILLYMEDVKAARKFMSAARSAARAKPVLVVKAGRAPEGAKAATSHTGALAGSDAVYDAAIRRAGMLRVLSTEELFDAVETLAHARPLQGERLAILTNGGGPGVLATDALVCGGGKLATLSEATLRKLDEVLPATWSHGNPVDIIGDAPGERYSAALSVLLKDEGVDAVLVMHAPTAIVPSKEVAQAVAATVQAEANGRSVLSCWLGGDNMAPARQLLTAGGVPGYATPEDAVDGFLQMVRYRHNQQLLMQAPSAQEDEFTPDRELARTVIEEALECGRYVLTEPEAKKILACYGIPVVETDVTDRVEGAVLLAQRIGFPVALKVLSPDITHKSDIGGVMLDLLTPDDVRNAALAIRERLHAHQPEARLLGFSVQAMARRPGAQELIVGASSDAVFGPVILFGQGGTAVETIGDRALALPPLNTVLARDLVSRTRVARLLAGYRDHAPADVDAICSVLVRISQLLADLPQVAELDINPLLADQHGVLALDARVRVAHTVNQDTERFAIRPYPAGLEERIEWDGAPLLLRPIRPEDKLMDELPPAQQARLSQVDYDREMTLIAVRGTNGNAETLGVARAVSDPDNDQAEFSVIVRTDMKGKGLGEILMRKLIACCHARGTGALKGEVGAENERMLRLGRKLGFSDRAAGGDAVQLHMALKEPA